MRLHVAILVNQKKCENYATNYKSHGIPHFLYLHIQKFGSKFFLVTLLDALILLDVFGCLYFNIYLAIFSRIGLVSGKIIDTAYIIIYIECMENNLE